MEDKSGGLQKTGLGSTLEHEEVVQGSEKIVSESDRASGLLLEETVEILLILLFRSEPSGEERRKRGGGRFDLQLIFSESCPVVFKFNSDMVLLKLLTLSKAAPRAGDWSTRD